MLPALRTRFPAIVKLWADGGYTRTLITWALNVLHPAVTVIKRTDYVSGYVVLPDRWCVERSFAWLLGSRRLARDYERRLDSSEAKIRWPMTMLMTCHLASPWRARTAPPTDKRPGNQHRVPRSPRLAPHPGCGCVRGPGRVRNRWRAHIP